MLFSKVTKVAACFGSVALVASYKKVEARDLIACHDCHMKRLPKAKELPLYHENNYDVEYCEKSTLPLISEISSIRKYIVQYISFINMVQEKAVHIYETGVAHSKSAFEHLKDEENKVQRMLIIASGGLVGLIYARRGGIFKKVTFTTLGVGATFTMFYPTISKEYALTVWSSSKVHIDKMLVTYGGYDTEKITEETNKKLEYVKSAMKFEGITDKLREKFHKNKNEILNKDEAGKVLETDGSKNNKDMYTTRSAA